MKVHENEIVLYYNPDSSADRKTLAYAKSITPNVRSQAYNSTPATTTMLREIIERLDMHPKQMLNKAHPYYQQNIKGSEFDDEDWLNVLVRNPQLFRAPIAIKGKRAVFCVSPTDVYKLWKDNIIVFEIWI